MPQRRGLAAPGLTRGELATGAQRGPHVERPQHGQTEGDHGQLNRGAGRMVRRLVAGDEQRERTTQPARRQGSSLRAQALLVGGGHCLQLRSRDTRSAVAERILIVDDDAPVRRMLERTLAAEGHFVSSAADGGLALAAVERSAPDLVILDVAMPGMDGLVVCRRLRQRGLAVPILLLTARDAVADRVAGLDAGADDYLVKPFAPEELSARVRALTRRGATGAERLQVGELSLDLSTRTAWRAGRELSLTGREADLLELLLRRPRAVVSREAALAEVWADDAGLNVVDRYVGYLRRKLGDPPLIHTVRGLGFSLRP